jgi:hypothetical protein
MKTRSEDELYNGLIKTLREKLAALTEKYSQKSTNTAF